MLLDIGLTEGEAKVYMALLEAGTTTTGSIIKKSGISASKVYDILNRLAEKGLVSHIMKAKTKYFRAADPDRIIDYLDEKEKEISAKKEEMKKLIPQLKAKLDTGGKREVEVFEGKKGIENIFWSIISELKRGEEYYVMGASYSFGDQYIVEFFKKYHAERARRGIKVKIMFNYDTNFIIDEIKKISEIKLMPQEIKTPVQIVVWKNKISIILWQKKPIAFTIDNKEVANSFKIYFDSLWGQNIRTYKGYDAFKKVWLEMLQQGDTLYLIGARGYFFDKRPKDAEDIVEAARKKGMKWKNVVDIETKGHRITQIEFAETRYFKEKITFPGVLWTCGKRTIIVNWAKGEPIATVIDDPDIADTYRNYFEILWGMAKPG